MRIIICGQGKPLLYLCKAFAAKGHCLAVINPIPEECESLARHLRMTILCGDGSMPNFLEDAGVREADALLAVTGQDPDNLAICQVAQTHFGVPKVLAQANDPNNIEAFKCLGIPAFSPTTIIGQLIEQKSALDEINSIIPTAGGRINITEITIPADSPVVGKALKEISLPKGVLIACIIRNDARIIPSGDTVILVADRSILITFPENQETALKALLEEAGQGS